MFRNMVTSLFKYDKIKTTDAKAKEIRRWADQIITLAKRGDLHARRQVMAIVREKSVVHKLFEEAPKRYGARKGGYTRVIKMGHRPGDAASVSLVELIFGDDEAGKKKKPASKKKASVKETVKTVAEEQSAAAAETEASDTAAPTDGAEADEKAAVKAEEAAPETAPAEPVADGSDEDAAKSGASVKE